MWARPVGVSESFKQDLEGLLPKYPELPAVIEAFVEALSHNPKLTRIPLGDGSGQDEFADVFVHLLDYPPLKEGGVQIFRIAYDAPPNHEANPWQRFTLLSIVKRSPEA